MTRKKSATVMREELEKQLEELKKQEEEEKLKPLPQPPQELTLSFGLQLMIKIILVVGIINTILILMWIALLYGLS